jgi:hypothetical protein
MDLGGSRPCVRGIARDPTARIKARGSPERFLHSLLEIQERNHRRGETLAECFFLVQRPIRSEGLPLIRGDRFNA